VGERSSLNDDADYMDDLGRTDRIREMETNTQFGGTSRTIRGAAETDGITGVKGVTKVGNLQQNAH